MKDMKWHEGFDSSCASMVGFGAQDTYVILMTGTSSGTRYRSAQPNRAQ